MVAPALPLPAPQPFDESALDAAAAALDGEESLLLLGGDALGEETLEIAGRIAARTGCKLLAEWANARHERGAGRVFVNRVPYPIDAALKVLAGFKRIVLVGDRAPIGFFPIPASLRTHPRGCRDQFARPRGHGSGRRTRGALDALAAVIARAIPEDGIVVDESVTSGRGFSPATKRAARHTWLNNCGGSIGYGMPLAIGCAIACPDRKVLGLIGDGSAMYTVQALWTMAREALDITVLIFANQSKT